MLVWERINILLKIKGGGVLEIMVGSERVVERCWERDK